MFIRSTFEVSRWIYVQFSQSQKRLQEMYSTNCVLATLLYENVVCCGEIWITSAYSRYLNEIVCFRLYCFHLRVTVYRASVCLRADTCKSEINFSDLEIYTRYDNLDHSICTLQKLQRNMGIYTSGFSRTNVVGSENCLLNLFFIVNLNVNAGYWQSVLFWKFINDN